MKKITTYKGWEITKKTTYAHGTFFYVFDQDGINHRSLFRDIKTLKEAKDYIDECINS